MMETTYSTDSIVVELSHTPSDEVGSPREGPPISDGEAAEDVGGGGSTFGSMVGDSTMTTTTTIILPSLPDTNSTHPSTKGVLSNNHSTDSEQSQVDRLRGKDNEHRKILCSSSPTPASGTKPADNGCSLFLAPSSPTLGTNKSDNNGGCFVFLTSSAVAAKSKGSLFLASSSSSCTYGDGNNSIEGTSSSDSTARPPRKQKSFLSTSKPLVVGEEEHHGEDVLGIELLQPLSCSSDYMSTSSQQQKQQHQLQQHSHDGMIHEENEGRLGRVMVGVVVDDNDNDGDVEDDEDDGEDERRVSPASSSPLPQHERIALEDRIVALEQQNATLRWQMAGQSEQQIKDMYHDPYATLVGNNNMTLPSNQHVDQRGGGAEQRRIGRGGDDVVGCGGFSLAAPYNTSTSSSFGQQQQMQHPPLGSAWTNPGPQRSKTDPIHPNLQTCPSAPLPHKSSGEGSALLLAEDMHRQLTILRQDNHHLSTVVEDLNKKKVGLETSQKRLKQALQAVTEGEKYKTDLLTKLSHELGVSTEREGSLRSELDACRIRLEAFAIAGVSSSTPQPPPFGDGDGIVDTAADGSCRSSAGPSEEFCGRDLATALVVSEKQNRATQAHNEELSVQNQQLQKRLKQLEKEVLPKGDKERQIYSRYLEMKASLSSLAGVLEEVNGQNHLLNARVQELEAELDENRLLLELEQGSSCKNAMGGLGGGACDNDSEVKGLQSRIRELEELLSAARAKSSSDNNADLNEQQGRWCPRCREFQSTILTLDGDTTFHSNDRHVLLDLDEMLSASDSEDNDDLEENATFKTARGDDDTTGGMMTAGETTEGPTPREVVDFSEGVEVTASEDADLAWREREEQVLLLTREVNECTVKLAEQRNRLSSLSNELELANQREAELRDELEMYHESLGSGVAEKDDRMRAEERMALRAEALTHRHQLRQSADSNAPAAVVTAEKTTVESRDFMFDSHDSMSAPDGAEVAEAWDLSIANTALHYEVAALRKDVLRCRADATRRQADLETLLAKTNAELSIALQKGEDLGAEVAKRQLQLESLVSSAQNELSVGLFDVLSSELAIARQKAEDLGAEFKKRQVQLGSSMASAQNEISVGLLDVLSSTPLSLGIEVLELKKRKVELEEEVTALKVEATGRQNEQEALLVAATDELSSERLKVQELHLSKSELQEDLDRLKWEVKSVKSGGISIRDESKETLEASLEIVREELRVERHTMNELKASGVHLQSELNGTKASHAEIEQRLKKSEALLLTTQEEVLKLHHQLESLHQEKKELYEKTELIERQKIDMEKNVLKMKADLLVLEQKSDSLHLSKKSEGLQVTTQEELLVQEGTVEEFQQENKQLCKRIDQLESQKMDLERNALKMQTELLLLEHKTDGLHRSTIWLQEEIDENPQLALSVQLQKQLEEQNITMETTITILNEQLNKEKEKSERFEVKTNELQDNIEEISSLKASLDMVISKMKEELLAERKISTDLLVTKSDMEDKIDNLKRDVEQSADQAKDLETTLVSTKDSLLAEQEKVEKLNTFICSLQAAVDAQLETLLASTKDELLGEHQKVDDLNVLNDSLRTEITALKLEVNALRLEVQAASEDVLLRQGRLDSARSELTIEERRVENLNSIHACLLDDIDSLKVEIKSVKDAKTELESSLASAQQVISSERDKVDEHVDVQNSLENEIRTLKGNLEISVVEADKANNQKHLLEASLAVSKNELFAVRENLENLETTNSSMQAELNSLKQSIEANVGEAKFKQVELTAYMAGIQQELSMERQKVAELKTSNSALQTAIDALKCHLDTTLSNAVRCAQEKADLEALLASTKEEFATLIAGEKQKNEAGNIAINALQKESDGLRGELEAACEKLSTANDAKTELESILAVANLKNNDLNSIKSDLQSELESLKINLQSCSASLIETAAEKTLSDSVLAITETKLEEEKHKVKEFLECNSALQLNVDELKSQLEKEKEKATELEDTMGDLKRDIVVVQQKLEAMAETNCSLKAEMITLNAHVETTDARALLVTEHKAELDSLLTRTKELLTGETGKVEDLRKLNARLLTDVQALNKDLETERTIAVQVVGVTNQNACLETQLATSNELQASQQQKIEELQFANTTLQTELSNLKGHVENITERSLLVTDHRSEIEVLLTTTKELLDSERQKVAALDASLSTKQSELESLRHEMGSASSRASFAIKKKSELEVLLSTKAEEIAAEKEKVEELLTTNECMESKINFYKSEIEAVIEKARNSKAELETLLSSTQQELAVTKGELADEKMNVASLSTSKSLLQEELDGLSANQQSELARALEKKGRLESKQMESKEKLRNERRKVEELTQRNVDLEKELSDLRQDVHSSIGQTTVEKGDLEAQLASASWQLLAEQQKVEELSEEKTLLEGKVASLEEDILNFSSQASERNMELNALLAEKELEIDAKKEEMARAKEFAEENDKQVSHLKRQIDELEKSNGELQRVRDSLLEESRLKAEEAADEKYQLESLLQATEDELAAERRKVVDCYNSESSMQFEVDALKEAMHNIMSTDREHILSSTREELAAERKRSDELRRNKLALESKLRLRQQSRDSTKASAFVQQKETDMVLANTKRELEVAVRLNEALKYQVENFDSTVSTIKNAYEEKLASVEERHNALLKEHEQITENHGVMSSDFLEAIELTNELTNKVESLETEIEALEDDREALMTLLKQREEALEDASSAKEALLVGEKKVQDLTNDKKFLESSLRVANQGIEKLKATSDVRVWETEMLLANTKKDLDGANLEKQRLNAKLISLESRLEEIEGTHQECLSMHSNLVKEMKLTHRESVNRVTNKHDGLVTENDELKGALKIEIEAREELVNKVGTLANTLLSLTVEKESLLERTATLARRDQIQKASLSTMNEEIAKLQATVADFQERFEYLAEQLKQAQERTTNIENEKENMAREFQKKEFDWGVDHALLTDRVNVLVKEAIDARDALDPVRNDLAEQLKRAQEQTATIENEKENMVKEFQQKESVWDVDRGFLTDRVNVLAKETSDARESLDTVTKEYNDSLAREVHWKSALDASKAEMKECRDEIAAEKSNVEQRLAEWNSERCSLEECITQAKAEGKESALAVEAMALSLKQHLAEWEAERENFTASIKNLEKKAKDAVDAAKGEFSEGQKLKETLYAKLKVCQEELGSWQEKVLAKEREIEEITTKVENNENEFLKRITELEEDISDLRAELETVTQDFNAGLIREEELEMRIDVSSQELQSCRDELLFERSEMEEVRQMLFSSNAELEVCNEHLADAKKRVQDLEQEKNQLDVEFYSKLQRGDVISKEARGNKSALAAIRAELAEANAEGGVLQSRLNATVEELEACKKQFSDAEYCNGVFKELIAKLNKANDTLESKNARLSDELGVLRAAQRGATSPTNTSRSLPSTAVRGMTDHEAEILHSLSVSEDNNFLRSQNEKFIAEIATLDRQLLDLMCEKDEIQKTADELQERVESLQESIDRLEEEARVSEDMDTSDLESTKKRNEWLEDQLAKSKVGVEEIAAKAKTMRQKLVDELEVASAREMDLRKEVVELRARNEAVEKRLDDQEKELDEFESDFALARDDARKVVEELRSQVTMLEKRNQQLMADGTVAKMEELKAKLRQLIAQNQKLQTEIDSYKAREKKLQKQLGLGGWK